MPALPRELIGRARELAAIATLLERAAGGAGGLALLTGEPGIGKTRLLEEAAAEAAAKGFAVAWGRAWELGGAPTYWPWIELLRTLFARAGSDDAEARALAELLPELTDPHASARDRRGERDGFALCDALASYLVAACEREPVLLVLDDLHAADPSSLQLAVFVARALRSARLVVLGSHRDLEARRVPELDAALSRLARHGERFVLSPLAIEEVASLVHFETGHDDAATAQMIHDATEGNPLFVRELLRLITARGAAGGGGVPAGVRAVIRERLALLTPATVALLQAAAVVGREFSLSLSAEVAGVTPEALDEAAAEARDADLLVDARGGRFRFSHALVAETLAADLPVTVRTRLHRRAAEALDRRLARDAASVTLDELAHHWLHAGTEAAARAWQAAAAAASAAMERLAFADAALGFERALHALSLVASDDGAQRAELLIAQSEAYVHAGERARAEAACEAAGQVAIALADGTLLARAALALGTEGTAGYADPALIRRLEHALEALPPGDGSWRARVMARLASARQPANDPLPQVALARDAIAMARRLGDDRVLLQTLHFGLGALMDFAPALERADLGRETVKLAAAARDRPRELRALVRSMFAYAELGDVPAFEAALAAYESLLGADQQPRFGWVPLMFRSMQANWEGRFDEGDRLEQQARVLQDRARGDGPPLVIGRPLGKALLIGDTVRIEAESSAIVKAYPSDPVFDRIVAADVAARRGQMDEARAILATVDFERERCWEHDPHVLEVASNLAHSLNHAPLAELLYPALGRRAGEMFGITGIAFSIHGSVDHALMQLAIVAGRPDDADRHAADALALCARMGARPIAARVKRDWALALLSRGPAGAHKAAALLAEALEVAQQLGMTHLAAACRAAVQRDVGPTSTVLRTAASAGPGVQLELEGEYWTVRGEGELCRVRDNRGMRMLAQLIEQPGAPLHVLDLSGVRGRVDAGDAGEQLDAAARLAYKRRLGELELQRQEATQWNDAGRMERATIEIDRLRTELARAFGLGNRERRSGSAVERARVNVRRRLTLAIEHIAKTAPALGRKLNAELRTGMYCSWEPRDRPAERER